MICINGSSINNKVVCEVGKFAILWNCFEREYCNNCCSPEVIKNVSKILTINEESVKNLANAFCERRHWCDMITSEYVRQSLHPEKAHMSTTEDLDLMQAFIDQEGDNLASGCLLSIYRIRNNLMHGLKTLEDINNQYELFRAVNSVLESIERKKEN